MIVISANAAGRSQPGRPEHSAVGPEREAAFIHIVVANGVVILSLHRFLKPEANIVVTALKANARFNRKSRELMLDAVNGVDAE